MQKNAKNAKICKKYAKMQKNAKSAKNAKKCKILSSFFYWIFFFSNEYREIDL